MFGSKCVLIWGLSTDMQLVLPRVPRKEELILSKENGDSESPAK